jgi:uncharacterized protein YdeI (YjbR/CyaY-like superfamily)
MINPKVDVFMEEGCGRCPLVGTPECKVITWRKELEQLRTIVLDSELVEEYKWSQPCYTYNGSNVLIVSAFKEYAMISFFKGSLLKDPEGILVKPGESSQAARQIRVTSVEEIIEIEPIIRSYILEAIAIEKAGLKVNFKKNPEPMPEELLAIFGERPEVKAAFEALTPGRQRGYILYFSAPKQSKTKTSRIEKCIPKIMSGKGMQDR